jgi:hypothetical protein
MLDASSGFDRSYTRYQTCSLTADYRLLRSAKASRGAQDEALTTDPSVRRRLAVLTLV